MKVVVLALYTLLAVALLMLQLRGVARRQTATAGDLVRLLVRRPAVRWGLLAAWVWWGWHIFVRVTL